MTATEVVDAHETPTPGLGVASIVVTVPASPDGAPEFIAHHGIVAGLKTNEIKRLLRHLRVPFPSAARKADLVAYGENWFRAEWLAQSDALGVTPDAPPVAAVPDAPVALAPVEDDKSVIPAPSKWQQIMAMAEYLSESKLVPDVLHKKPHDIGVVLLAANDLGIPLTQALNKLYIIGGKVGMEAELMRALVLRDHHTINVETEDASSCTMYGRRVDNGDEARTTFTLDDALAASLISSIDRDGRPVPIRGKDVWRAYTADMLCARATARLARRLFPDCIGGVSYTPDELGYVDEAPAAGGRGRAGESEPTITAAQFRDSLRGRIADLDDDAKAWLLEQRRTKNLPKLDDASPAALRTIGGLIEQAETDQAAREAEATRDVTDAETVPEPGDHAGGTDAVAATVEMGPCTMCGAADTFRTVGADLAVRCVDIDECLGRISAAATEAVGEAPSVPSPVPEPEPGPDSAPLALESGDGTVEVLCSVEGCDEPVAGDDLDLCEGHATKPF